MTFWTWEGQRELPHTVNPMPRLAVADEAEVGTIEGLPDGVHCASGGGGLVSCLGGGLVSLHVGSRAQRVISMAEFNRQEQAQSIPTAASEVVRRYSKQLYRTSRRLTNVLRWPLDIGTQKRRGTGEQRQKHREEVYVAAIGKENRACFNVQTAVMHKMCSDE